MRIPLSLDTRRSAYEEDSKWLLKALLRISATLSALIAVFMFAAAISLTNANFINTMGNGDWTDGLALAPVRHITNLTSQARLFCSQANRSNRPGHDCHYLQPHGPHPAIRRPQGPSAAPIRTRWARLAGLGPVGAGRHLRRGWWHVLVLD